MSKLKIYKNAEFFNWQKKSGLKNSQLTVAIKEVETGLYEAKLGDLYKKRISKPGTGKSGGYRTIIAYHTGGTWFFIYGFSKGEMENITNKHLKALKNYVKDYLFPNISKLIKTAEIIEVLENE